MFRRLSVLSGDDEVHRGARPIRRVMYVEPSAASGQEVLYSLAKLKDFRSRPLQHACTIAGRGLDGKEWARYIPVLPYQNTYPP
jgi:hypothetical protein